MNKSKVIVSLDYSNAKQALDFCQKVNPMDCRIKVGKELFTAEGPKLIEKLRKLDYEIFLDLKLHDIPNTVKKSLQNILSYNPTYTTLHDSGGSRMLKECVELKKELNSNTNLIGVTMLTSFDDDSINEIGMSGTVNKND